MSVISSCVIAAPHGIVDRKTAKPRQAEKRETGHGVTVQPGDAVQRRALAWDGMAAEVVRTTRRERLEFHFCGPLHLLAVYDQGMRRDGDTFVEGLPRSRLRDVTRKLTFVPAGHAYHEWYEPCPLVRVAYFYFDPARMPAHPETGAAPASLVPRLFFENAALADTALKLARLIENMDFDGSHYFEALGVVLAHELVRPNTGVPRIDVPAKGGLAAWQQRAVTTYIEEHLAQPISLATLARLVRLSPYYFCHAFKRSFGLPPHRYHSNRRIERAKLLLAQPTPSVTDIGLIVGYSETSSFTTAFHRATGITPTVYRRTLA